MRGCGAPEELLIDAEADDEPQSQVLPGSAVLLLVGLVIVALNLRPARPAANISDVRQYKGGSRFIDPPSDCEPARWWK
jgi:hypothetical protein